MLSVASHASHLRLTPTLRVTDRFTVFDYANLHSYDRLLKLSRQRQAELVQTLINEVRRLGAEQHTCQKEIRRLQEERFLFGELPHDPEEAQQHVPAARSIVDTRIGKPLVF